MKLITTALIMLVLAGCATGVNNQRQSMFENSVKAWKDVEVARADAHEITVTECEGDAQCVIAATALNSVLIATVGSRQPQQPQLTTPAEDFVRITSGIAAVSNSITPYAAQAFQSRQNRILQTEINANDNQTLQTLFQQQGEVQQSNIDSLAGIVGSLPPTTQIGGDQITIGGDQTTVDNGSQIGDTRRDTLDDGSFIGDDNRYSSPGEFENVGNNPEPPPDDGLPPGVVPIGPGG